jgi:hypothetical protein
MNCFESQHFNQVEVSNAGADPGGGGGAHPSRARP